MSALLEQVLALELSAFAIIHRPESGSPGTLDILTGQVTEYKSLDDIPLADDSGPGPALDTLVLVPYRQLADRGFAARDDATPLLAMSLTARDTVPVAEALAGFRRSRRNWPMDTSTWTTTPMRRWCARSSPRRSAPARAPTS